MMFTHFDLPQTTGDFIFGMEDGEGDGTVTDIYSVPVKVRNIDSVTDLPVDPGRRTPRSSHQANPGEMVEIPLNEDEKCKHLFNQDLYRVYIFNPRELLGRLGNATVIG